MSPQPQMKALVFDAHGDLSRVSVQEVPRPVPQPGWVLVRTQAAALNHLDLYVLGGLPGIDLSLPHVMGSDGAGIVEEAGEGVDGFQTGDRVMLNPCIWCGRCEFCQSGEQSLCIRLQLIGEHCPGTFGEYFRAPAISLAKIPGEVSFQDAAAYSLVFQTAWRMLSRANLRAGQDVFIHGIGSGVSTACLQIVKMSGARAFVSSSSDEKLKRAVALGADYALNYRQAELSREIARITSKRGVDIVVDSVGAETWLESLRLVCKGGRIVTCGATTGPNPATEIRLIFWKQLQIIGSTMSNSREYQEVVRLLGQGRLRPVVDRAFPLSQGRQALEYLKKGEQFGKVVLLVGD